MKNPTTQTNRLSYLDGVRGLTALYIVLNHATLNIVLQDTAGAMSKGVRSMTSWFANGLLSVQIFIVLSGFCLMLAAVGDGGRLRGGVPGFALRRARRILPCYYGAMAFSLLLLAVVPGMAALDPSDRVTRPGLISHLFLVQNFSTGWITQIDPPMWSLSIEWQIYFIFALLLLPLWQRLGTLAALAAAVGIGYGIHWFTKGVADYSQPFYIGFFGMGMAAASVAFGTSRFAERARRLPWGIIAAASYLMFLGIMKYVHSKKVWMISTQFLAFAVACGLLALVTANPKKLNLRGFLEWKPVLGIGHISYSLYLTHFPVLAALYALIHRWSLSPDAEVGVMIAAGVPLSLAVAYVFYRFLELPFFGGSKAAKARAKAAPAVALAAAVPVAE